MHAAGIMHIFSRRALRPFDEGGAGYGLVGNDLLRFELYVCFDFVLVACRIGDGLIQCG